MASSGAGPARTRTTGPRATRAAAAPRPARAVGCLLVALAVMFAGGLGLFFWLRDRGNAGPVPGQQRCVATAGGSSVVLDLDQARLTSIIVGVSVRRKLPPRAASIAMAAAYQETGIRNLGYGDRDSVGLFQQRPSQGWGTARQLQDPYYASGKFYDALVKLEDWQTDEINDVAQRVQRSGYPEAYRAHAADGQVLASTLTGRSPGGFSCLERAGRSGDPKSLVAGLKKTFGSTGADRQGKVVTIKAASKNLAWAYAHYAVANSGAFGLVSAEVGGQRWDTDRFNLPSWTRSGATTSSTLVTLTVR